MKSIDKKSGKRMTANRTVKSRLPSARLPSGMWHFENFEILKLAETSKNGALAQENWQILEIWIFFFFWFRLPSGL